MGEVYLARDTQLDRTVALKILPSDIAADPQRLRRFVQEARAAAALKHSHIAHIYEIGEAEGQHFIAMEFVEGLPLSARIKGSPLAVSEIVELGIQLADALDEAHSKGITHRDIKPSNVMITARGDAKLLDFGLAKVRRSIDQERSDDISTQLKTTEGIVVGTVMYMSPEQALGQVVDFRSDIFSLGTVLYEMATGRLPFTGSTKTEVIDRIAHAQPEAISRFNYDVPTDLERIIRKCLEKDKSRRYQSARELQVDLENLKRDSTIGSAVSEKPAPLRQKSVPYWIVAAIVVLILAGGGIYLFKIRSQSVETAAIDSIAILPLVNASGDPNMEYLSDGITENIINSLSQLPNLRVIPRVAVFRYKGHEIDPQVVGREFGVRAVLTGKVIQLGDTLSIQTELIDVESRSQRWGQKYNRKVTDLLAVQDEIAREISENLRLKLSGDDQRQLAKHFTRDPEAYQLYLKGRYYWKKYDKEAVEKSISYFNQAIEKDPGYALAYSGLADAYVVLGVMHLPPKEVFPKAKAAAEKALAIDETLAAGHISLGACKLFYDWDWPGAQREAQRARELNTAYAKAIEINTNYDDEHHFYCQALDTVGRPQESIAEMKRALELDPLSISMNMEMGWSLYISRDYDRAIAQCQKTIEMDPNFSPSYFCTAQAYEQKGMYREAIASMARARTLIGDDPSLLAELGYAYALSGQKGEARKLADTLKQKASKEYVDAALIGLIHIGLGEKDEAFKWLWKAFDARSSWMTWLKVEPKFDSLRKDPHFAELMRRVGLPQ